jgi:hypothetical protein
VLKPSFMSVARWIALFAGAWLAAPTAAALQVALSDVTVTVTGVAPGGSVALLSVSHEPGYYIMRIVRRSELLLDEDQNGQVDFTPERGVAFQSIWVAVDVATGEMAMASPPGFVTSEMLQPGPSGAKSVQILGSSLDIWRGYVTLLLVRPGVGAWAATIREGMTNDADPTIDQQIHPAISTLPALQSAGPAAPSTLQAGDVVVVLDPSMLQYSLNTIE